MEELLEMFLTDAVEGSSPREQYHFPRSAEGESARTVSYDLRLMRYPDGTLEWKD